jgi:hypothetical protein
VIDSLLSTVSVRLPWIVIVSSLSTVSVRAPWTVIVSLLSTVSVRSCLTWVVSSWSMVFARSFMTVSDWLCLTRVVMSYSPCTASISLPFVSSARKPLKLDGPPPGVECEMSPLTMLCLGNMPGGM